MSATTDGPVVSGNRVDELPRFPLEYLLDDAVEPTEVTVFRPGEDEITTHWITVGIDHAVPLDELR